MDEDNEVNTEAIQRGYTDSDDEFDSAFDEFASSKEDGDDAIVDDPEDEVQDSVEESESIENVITAEPELKPEPSKQSTQVDTPVKLSADALIELDAEYHQQTQALAKKYDDGEFASFADWQAQQAQLTSSYNKLYAQLSRQAEAESKASSDWQKAGNDFLEINPDFKKPAFKGALNAVLEELFQDANNNQLSDTELLAKAASIVRNDFGLVSPENKSKADELSRKRQEKLARSVAITGKVKAPVKSVPDSYDEAFDHYADKKHK